MFFNNTIHLDFLEYLMNARYKTPTTAVNPIEPITPRLESPAISSSAIPPSSGKPNAAMTPDLLPPVATKIPIFPLGGPVFVTS